jgi:aminoglycoside phosphotransferase (APT) family kinase protein
VSEKTYVPSDPQRSSRDLDRVRAGLEKAFAARLPGAAEPRVGQIQGTSATGMSSETLLFDLSWTDPGGPRTEQLVARVAPADHDVPVFPRYDLPGQFRTIATVARLTDVPVPPPWWCEPDPAIIGSPFFVMGRVEGAVPPDIMPYNFGESWLYQATPEEQAALQESTIGVLTRLHAIDRPKAHFTNLMGDFPGDSALRRHLASRRHWYDWAARDSGPSRLIEKGFAWLEDNFPSHEGETVFNWGDSRIGNILYRDFHPVAVLDWEMAGLGPRELDLGWLVYIHQMFEDMAARYGFPGMPGFLRADDAATTYEKITGYTPRELPWHITYAGVQLAIVYLRTGMRAVRFGEREAPADADDLLINGRALDAMVSRGPD